MKTKFSGKDKLIPILMSEFRTHGFNGLSLNQISKSTELGKASLYHYFPEGKDQMASEVMNLTLDWLNAEIVLPLTSAEDPRVRLKKVLATFEAFYECGERACILEAMISSNAPEAVKQKAKVALNLLIDSFKKFALEVTNNKTRALSLAETTVAEIQGALILARGTQNKAIFKRSLARIERSFFTDLEHSV